MAAMTTTATMIHNKFLFFMFLSFGLF